MIFFFITTYSAPTVVEDCHDGAYNACCTIDCSSLPASDWAAENADPNHRGILSQTIMQTHCLYLFIMRRYFWNLFRNCGSQNTPSICSKIFKKSLQHVFIRGMARLRRTRDKTHITQLTLGGDFNLVTTRFLSQNQSKLVPKMVHKTP